MLITVNEQEKIFKLDTSLSSYVLKVYENGYLLNLYYGKKIPDAALEMFETRPTNVSFSPMDPAIENEDFTVDTAPMEYSCNGAGDFRISAVSILNPKGDSVTDLRYAGYRVFAGKPAIPGLPSTYVNCEDEAETLEIDMKDQVTGAAATLVYTVLRDHPIMTKTVRIGNASQGGLDIERVFSACNDFPSMDFDMITLWGRHNKERNVERRALAHGLQGVQSKRGSSSHCQNPFVALARKDATEDMGEVFGFNLVYSGNFSIEAECDLNLSTRLLVGINPVDFTWHLEPGETFYAPEVVCVYSDSGLGEMSRSFHRYYNGHLIRGRFKKEKRPLLINSWEAAYFDFDSDKLVGFAEAASKLGIEMLVMDDGWFGVRNSDNCSLGDWYVNTDKLPGGLAPLIQRVNDLGMKFGIWYEPEMISPNSDLFRAHPDWHVHVESREPRQARWQYVLDVSRADVRENIKKQMAEVLSHNKIDYVKWDFNRNLSDAASALLPAERKKEFFHRFVLGTYELMDWFTKTYPDIMFENCSGGGGRFDAGMLYYSPQIWTSDNTDPIQRISIQFGTSMCYPASTMGAHVSDNPRGGYGVKADVALWGSFGYEMDPRHLTAEEQEMFRMQVKEYHKYYDLMHSGDLYRLVSPFENRYKAAWMMVSQDKNEALCTVVCLHRWPEEYYVLKLRGLDPEKYYTCEENGKVYSGALLMYAGLNITEQVNEDFASKKYHFVAR